MTGIRKGQPLRGPLRELMLKVYGREPKNGEPIRVEILFDAIIAINEVNIKNTKLRELAERTCGDGCHCMAENGGKCALRYLEMKE